MRLRAPLNRFGAGRVVAPFHFQPTRVGLRGGFAALGISSSATGAAAGAAQGAAAGAVAGPIGAAAGAIIGAAMSFLSHQSNPQIQIDKNTALQYFGQYVNVVGTVSGRSIGLNNMDMIFRGACFDGHFPSWGNSTELPDSLLSMPGSPYGNNANCFAPLWQYAKTGVPSAHYPNDTGNGGVPVRDALTFVNRYVWPSNSRPDDTNPWATNTDSLGKQIIYDAADAYLATQDPTIPPLIGQTVQGAAVVSLAPVIAPVGSSAAAPPAASPSPASYSAPGSGLVVGGSGTLISNAGTWTLSGGTFTLNGATVATYSSGSGTVGLYYANGQVYRYDSTGGTYVWNNGWQSTTQVPTPPTAISNLIAQAAAAAPVTTAPVTTPVTAIAPVGTAATQTPAQLVATPPAAGTAVQYAPDMSQAAAPVLLPTGLLYEGSDPYNGSWILQNTSTGGLYVLWQGALVPYTSGMFAPVTSVPQVASTVPTATIATTSSGQAVTQADLQALAAQLAAQGQTAQQAYTSALQTLANSGVASTPALQAAVQSAVQTTPTPAVATAGVSDNTWVGLLAVAGVLFATARPQSTPRRRRRKARA